MHQTYSMWMYLALICISQLRRLQSVLGFVATFSAIAGWRAGTSQGTRTQTTKGSTRPLGMHNVFSDSA